MGDILLPRRIGPQGDALEHFGQAGVVCVEKRRLLLRLTGNRSISRDLRASAYIGYERFDYGDREDKGPIAKGAGTLVDLDMILHSDEVEEPATGGSTETSWRTVVELVS